MLGGGPRNKTTPRRVTRLHRLASTLGLSVGAIIVALLVIELGLRVVAPRENVPQREFDRRLGWRGRPNLDCVLNEGHFEIAISQNSRGFRDRERAVDKPRGEARVLCCGDSFTWGWGVPQDEIYTAVLERRYDEAGVAVEVLNAGVGGYSTDQLLLYLEPEGFSYAPDYVVYQATWNDVRDNPRTVVEAIYHKPFFELGDDGRLVLRGSPVPPLGAVGTLKYIISRHSRLAYFLRHRLHVARFAGQADEGGASGAVPTSGADGPAAHAPGEREVSGADVGYPFRLFCRLVTEMDAACREHGANFTALIDFSVTDRELEYWESVCGHVDARFVADYLRARGKAAGAPAYIPNDGHWTADGHRWIADLLYEDVLRGWSGGPYSPDPAAP
jgi:hypothetical protein